MIKIVIVPLVIAVVIALFVIAAERWMREHDR